MSVESKHTAIAKSLPAENVSVWVYQQIIRLQQQQPEWLLAKYRDLPWQGDRYQVDFTAKLAIELGKATNSDDLISRVQQVWQKLLVNEFFQSSTFTHLMHELAQLSEQNFQNQFEVLGQSIYHLETNGKILEKTLSENNGSAIALLLLDAENLQLEVEAERFLSRICPYPIQIKIAFANWRSLGKQDLELHERGYDLIHVPGGRDNADGKMIAMGSAIREHYPTVKAVLVCSSDKVMTNLCNKLQQQGIAVYSVKKQKDIITVQESQTGRRETFSLKPEPEIPPLEECLAQLKALIQAEQKVTSHQWVKLSRISEIFQKHYQFKISQVVHKYAPGKKARDIFIENPAYFVIHQDPNQTELYVTLFEAPNPVSSSNSQPAPTEKEKRQVSSVPKSRLDLENSLSQLVLSLGKTTADGSVPIAILGSEFNKQFGKPITQVIKDLQLASSFIKFVRTCSGLKIKTIGKLHHVMIASKS